MATISRLREKEGRQKAVPVLVLFEPALVLPDHSTRRVLTVVALFFQRVDEAADQSGGGSAEDLRERTAPSS